MNYIGNFSSWVQDEWVSEILSNPGWSLPKDLEKDPSVVLNSDERKWFKAGYKRSDHFFSAFYKEHCSFDIKAPWSPQSWDWWIVKMMPGQFIPVHGDLSMATRKNAKSYWMPFQDWEIGHVFMHQDKTITNYKKGDVFEYDASILHCAVNISLVPRIILQVREYVE